MMSEKATFATPEIRTPSYDVTPTHPVNPPTHSDLDSSAAVASCCEQGRELVTTAAMYICCCPCMSVLALMFCFIKE